MDPLTIIAMIITILTIINNALSFAPDGYPRSIVQVFIWLGYHLNLWVRPKIKSKNMEEKKPLINGLREVII